MSCSFFSSLGVAYLLAMIAISLPIARWQISICRRGERYHLLRNAFLTLGVLTAGVVLLAGIVAEPIFQLVGGVNVDDFFDEPVCEDSIFFGNAMFSWLPIYLLGLLVFRFSARTKGEDTIQ